MAEDFLRNFFFERHIEPKDDWLRATVDFMSRNNTGRPLSNEQLADLLYEQWLFSDIANSSQPCLNISPSAAKVTVTASMVLQIVSVLDVGTPLLGQFQKLTKSVNDNATVTGGGEANAPAWEPKPRRMLWFEVTDGYRSLRAMEYRPIGDMNTMTAPGAKLLLFGEIVCRNGVLLLSSENCQLLGGDVDSVAENNNPVKMMADKLKKSIPVARNDPATQALPLTQALRPTQTNLPAPPAQQFVRTAPATQTMPTTTQPRRPVLPPEQPSARAVPTQAMIQAPRAVRPPMQQNARIPSAPVPSPASRPIPPPPPQQPMVRPAPAPRATQENWSIPPSVEQNVQSSAGRPAASGALRPNRDTAARQTAPYWPNPMSQANAGGAHRQTLPLTQAPQAFSLTQASQALPLTQAPQALALNQASRGLPLTQAPQAFSLTQAPQALPLTQASRAPLRTSAFQAVPLTQAAPSPQVARPISTVTDRRNSFNSRLAPVQQALPTTQTAHRSMQPRQAVNIEQPPYDDDDDMFAEEEPLFQIQQSSPPLTPLSQQSRLQNLPPAVPSNLQADNRGPDLNQLNLTFINDAVRATRYAVGTQLRTLKAVLITVLSPMRIEGGRWMLKIRVSDGTANLDCSFDDALLSRLLCMTVSQAQELSHSSDQERKEEGNMRIKSLELSMRRMDLLFDVEFSAGNRTMPIIRNMVTLAEKFNCF